MKKKSKILRNKYFWISLCFIIWMVFLDNYSYFDHLFLDKQIDELEDSKKYYLEETKKDNKKIKQLKDSVQIERYAREQYFMKRENEDIYVIEFEKDSLKLKK